MRTTKRFTPSVLERFRQEGRGSGVFDSYTGWHKVTRGDPTSRGRSHIMTLRGRAHDFLSDLERNAALFAWMHPQLIDLREQFPLALEASPHELCAYEAASRWTLFPGTLALAEQHATRHPITRGRGESAPWVMTTDLLLTLRSNDGKLQLLAIACKYDQELCSKRKLQLLALERAYWEARGVCWLLLTERLMDKAVVGGLLATWQWGLVGTAAPNLREIASEMAMRLQGYPLETLILRLADRLGDLSTAQQALWLSVWQGCCPLKIRFLRPAFEPVVILEETAFWEQNPIVVRRSAWIS